MTREEFEDVKSKAIEELIEAAEDIETSASVEYYTDDELENVIDKAELDVEHMEQCVERFKEKIRELKELRRNTV